MMPSTSFTALSSLDLAHVSGGQPAGGMSQEQLTNILAGATFARDQCLVKASGNAWDTTLCNTQFIERVSGALSPHLGNAIPQTSLPVCDRTRSGCFVAGTLVRTADGLVAIEHLGVGDLVATPAGRLARVRRATRASALTIVRITLADGTTVDATPQHHFYDASGILLPAEALPVGTPMRIDTGSVLRIAAVETVVAGIETPVYNLALEHGIAFFANGLAVESARSPRQPLLRTPAQVTL